MRKIAAIILAVVFFSGWIALVVYLNRRPMNIEITQAEDDPVTAPSLVKFAIDNSGAQSNLTVRIDETRFVANNSIAAHLLTVGGLPDNVPGADDDLMLYIAETTNFTKFSSLGSVVSVVYDEKLKFPYKLPRTFDPARFQSFAITDGSIDGETGELALVRAVPFNGSPTTPTGSPGMAPIATPMTAPLDSPVAAPVNETVSPMDAPITGPVNEPVAAPVDAPVAAPVDAPVAAPVNQPVAAPVDAPVAAPVNQPPVPSPTPAPVPPPTPAPVPPPTPAPVPNPPALPMLVAVMSGTRSYNVGGTFTIGYRQDLVNGAIAQIPILTLTDTEVPSAPGPYLYLSKRPSAVGVYDESTDIFIPIDGTVDGSFTKAGTFTQDLDEIMDASQVQEYANGSFIVWCRPFTTWLGGGQLSVV